MMIHKMSIISYELIMTDKNKGMVMSVLAIKVGKRYELIIFLLSDITGRSPNPNF